MKPTSLTAQIARKGSRKETIAARVVRQPELLSELFQGLTSDRPQIKFGCSKVLRLVSEQAPTVLYPDFDFFAGLLDCDNNFLKWDAARVVANLAPVDSGRRIERILARYLRPIPGPTLITAANLVQNAAKIARAKPRLARRIAQVLLQVERGEYPTLECRNVVIGHAIESFDKFYDLLDRRASAPVLEFVQRQLANRRNAVRKKAAQFLKRHGAPSRAETAARPNRRRPVRGTREVDFPKAVQRYQRPLTPTPPL